MNKELDEKVNSEFIRLQKIINMSKKSYDENYDLFSILLKEDQNPNKSEQEIESEIKEEIKNNSIKHKNENLKHYQIDNEKNK